ncbi:MAG: hypothetical protein OXE99_08890 [Cellvibrionales bacterium]|nr:hypothetical protein [Cellvibrionales bacterium]
MSVNKNWPVTNNSAQPVSAISAYDPKSNDSPSMQTMYELPLTYLSLSHGESTLPASGVQSDVILDGTNPDGSYRSLYDVIFAHPVNGFPVVDTSVFASLKTNEYPPFMIKDSDSAAMQNTYNFFRLIQAYPTSNLAQDFEEAVKQQKDNELQVNPGTTNSIDAFFQSTKGYKNCSQLTYAAIASYNKAFAGASVGFAESYTFHLYSANAGKVEETGSITFTLNNQSNLFELTDANGGYTITYNDPNGNATQLTYDSGQFVSDVHSDLPAICLVVSWASKNQVNRSSDTQNTIVPIMAGFVNGIKATGTSTKQDTGDGSSTWGFPTTVVGWFNFVCGLFGTGMGIYFLVATIQGKKAARLAKERANDEQQLSDAENERINQRIDGLSEQVAQSNQQILDRLQTQQKFTDNIDILKQNATDVIAQLNGDDQQRLLESEISEYGDQLDTLAKYGVTEDLAEAAAKLRTASGEIKNAQTPEEIKAATEKWKPQLEEVRATLNTRANSLQREMTEDAKKSINESNEHLDDIDKQQKALEEEQQQEEEGNADEDADFENSSLEL